MPPSCRFIKSAVLPQEYPAERGPEVAIAGRSNAGKSSLINLLTGSKIAKVSSTPGKTRLMNFFEMNSKYMLVDMPGYGFASRSHSEVVDWETMVEAYLKGRQSLTGLILVMDIRRRWSEEEQMLKNFTDHRGLPLMLVLTKTDKISRSEMLKCVATAKKEANTPFVFPVSVLKRTGHEELEEFLYKSWIEPKLGKHP